jgi:hypothetical protein
MDTQVAAGGTLIRRYALALTPTGAGIEAAVTAAPVPPLGGGPGSHGSAAAHAFTIAVWIQRRLWDLCLDRPPARRPDLGPEHIARENARFVAPPGIAPPHSTGGAVMS